MASGTINGAMTGSYGVQIKWTSTPNVETNTSEFVMKTYVLHPYMNISGRTGSTTIDGSTASYKTGARKSDDSPWLVSTRTKTIQHNDDGTKEIDVSASFPFDLDSSTHGRIRTKKASGKCVLDNIPRASEVSSQTASVVIDGSNKWSVVLKKHSNAFWHKATLTMGSSKYTTTAFDTTTAYAIPTSWLNSMPNAAKSTVTVAIQTYSDSSCTTAIGDLVYTSFDVYAPSSAAPTISDGWASISPYNTGTAAAAFTVYVQGYSKAQVTFNSAKVAAKYGASIASVKIAWDGTDTTAAPYLTLVLSKSGTQTVVCTVTDSRGMQSSKSLTINVEAYSAPTLSEIQIYRCNSSGAEDDAGTFLYFKATANISSCAGQNTATVNAAYKPASNSIWSNVTTITSGVGSALGAGALSPTTSYNAKITVTDRLGKTASFETVISTADAAFNLKKGGKGGAFGKYAETDGLLDCEWEFIARGGITGVTNYTPAETDTGGWFGGKKVYRKILSGEITQANASTGIGSISNLATVLEMHGFLNASGTTRMLSDYYVSSSGAAYAKAAYTGTAKLIVFYTKSEE